MTTNLVPDDYYRAARKLLPEMEGNMREIVEELLNKAESGEKTDNRLVEIITEDKNLRKKFRDALETGQEKTMGMEYSGLGGNVSSPDAQKYICPVPGHDFTRRIQKAGEDPGSCPTHNVALIPFEQKGGQ